MAFCRFLSVYLPSKPKAEAGVGMKARKTVSVNLKVPLSLVGALPALRREQDPAIWLD